MTGQPRYRPGDQAPPVPNGSPSMHDLVIADLAGCPVEQRQRDAAEAMLQQRRQLGLDRYKSLLQAGNGRDWRRDLIDELADATVYARQGFVELAGQPGAASAWDLYQMTLSTLFTALEISGGAS